RGDGDVFLSWRWLATDPDNVAFNVYRQRGDNEPVRVNSQPIAGSTCIVDEGVDLTEPATWFVRALRGDEAFPADRAATAPANTPANPYLSVPIQTPDGYHATDCSVGALDGDGQYEIVVHMVGRGRDNSQSGRTTEPILHAYRLDGTQLWSINLGRNIREGAHYTQFIVYDLDGDGRAEVAMKTADGTRDGTGVVIGNANADHRNSSGYILSGPEFLTIFNGQTGRAMATTNYVPARGTVSSWGDSYGNRVDRFLAGVAYLDGTRPSLIMARGYYTRSVIVAWDWRNGQLAQRWTFDSNSSGNGAYAGQGAHSLTIGDVDGDGRDEIVYGSATIDDNGRGLYTTGLGHGDALHLGDFLPSRPGLEVFMVHECPSCYGQHGVEMHDARTGQIIW